MKCRFCKAEIKADGFGRMPGKCPQCYKPTAGRSEWGRQADDDSGPVVEIWTTSADSSDSGGDCGGGE